MVAGGGHLGVVAGVLDAGPALQADGRGRAVIARVFVTRLDADHGDMSQIAHGAVSARRPAAHDRLPLIAL